MDVTEDNHIELWLNSDFILSFIIPIFLYKCIKSCMHMCHEKEVKLSWETNGTNRRRYKGDRRNIIDYLYDNILNWHSIASVSTNVWVNKNVSIRSDLRYISDKIFKVLKVVFESQTYNARRDLPEKKIKQKQTNKKQK